MNDVDRVLVELAGRQHQVFSREQARAAGLSPSALSKRVARGQLVECSPSGLHFPGVTVSYRGQLMAGLLDLGPGALVSEHAAGYLHGLDHFEEGRLERQFVKIVSAAGLPIPVLQQRYRLQGVGIARVDFEFLTYPIVVEVGGRRGYLSAEERRHQKRRRTALQLAGKTVYFFTADDVFNDPDFVIRTLFAALSASRAAG